MPRFADCSRPTSIAALSELQREQLRAYAAVREPGLEDPGAGFGTARLRGLEIWQVLDDAGAKRFEAWVHDVDAGAVFAADGRLVGTIEQFSLRSSDAAAWDFVATAAAATTFADDDAGAISWVRDDA
ncbi:MAG: hypothetical protein K1X88_10095 [Nannocystaceae bacterium]|nr:hypothetical protein [Nannocystaceae bacterium]